ncbi:hypothetical protein FA10DRAFT_276837 [Acaromyces ingoldii]|uniref:mRNA splicing factor n=1 Tax=Acaromyces ingoldii TaxID=215250 RepID=A0A316YTE9_9BASI|nr:hypothetical protein FA10DRAFT_276837 [Acaromyces ingoldii]PWN92840.1 hypothetical protein FA10DRAFT_276837 [Acaromyces ingoldii]
MEAASASRRARIEALKKKKSEWLSSQRQANGSISSRQRRIEALQRAAAAAGEVEGDEEEDDDNLATEHLERLSIAQLLASFRRLAGQGKKLRIEELKNTIETDIAGYQEAVLAADEARREQELDLTNIAPKKLNWDLKRDMEKRLAKLERRDKEARLILIRQRVAAAAKMGDGTAPATGSAPATTLSAQEAQLAASTMGRGSNGMDQLDDEDDSDEEGSD